MAKEQEADLQWASAIHEPPVKACSCMIQSRRNVAPSFTNLHKWGKRIAPSCDLCGGGPGKVGHILNHFPVALKDHRYTHRHNSVLTVLKDAFEKHLRI